jgi:hypothetical protein
LVRVEAADLSTAWNPTELLFRAPLAARITED